MDLHGFVDVREFRVQLPDPLYPYQGRQAIRSAILADVPKGSTEWLGIQDLAEVFTPNFAKRNPLNIPGPIYGAETDTCLTGPSEAPHNVLVDKNGQEFVFKQAANADEFRDLVSAAVCECLVGFGADGDAHWRLGSIRKWWQGRDEMLNDVGEQWCDAEIIEQWRRALQGGAEGYLRAYAFFVENGRVPRQGDSLPDLT